MPWAPAADDFLARCFPALAAAPPRRAVLVVPDSSLYLLFRTLRIFCKAGVAVDLLCPRHHPIKFSRYVRHTCEAEDWRDVETKFARLLRSPQRPWRRILVAHEPTVRRLLQTLDAETLAAWQPGISAPGAREFYEGKFGLPAAQARWGLPIPPSRVCRDAAEVRELAEDAGWPVVVKPADHMGGLGVQKFDDAAQLAAGRDLHFPLLAQKFIEGPRVVLDLFCSGGKLLAWLASYSSVQAKGPFSYSTGRHFRAMPALRPLAELVARESRYEGFCGVDCVEEAGTGRIYVIEFNPRATAGWRFGRDCGVDFAPAVAAWAGGATLAAPLTPPPGCDVPAHYFPTDFYRCFRRHDWRGLQNWLPGANSRHDICWDDPVVFMIASARRLRKRLQNLATFSPPAPLTPWPLTPRP